MKNKEVWKDVVGYEGSYQISSLGNVRSVDRVTSDSLGKTYNRKGVPRISTPDRSGYLVVGLNHNGVEKKFRVHRLVGLSFIKNPLNYPEINHKDEDKSNNNVDNLEWCTRSYNINYGDCTSKLSRANSISIVGENITTGEIVKFYGMRNAEKYGFNHSGISECCSGKRKHHKGYIWRCMDEEQ